jgi:hypothetical protein
MEFSAEQVETKEGEFWVGCRQLGSNPRSIPRGMSDVCWEILITTYLKGENCSRAALVLRYVKQLRQGTGNVYIHCAFRDSVLWYGGGDNTLFDDDNLVEGESYLRRSQNSCRHPEVVEQLTKRFDFEHGGWKGVEDRPPACPSPTHSVRLFPQP